MLRWWIFGRITWVGELIRTSAETLPSCPQRYDANVVVITRFCVCCSLVLSCSICRSEAASIASQECAEWNVVVGDSSQLRWCSVAMRFRMDMDLVQSIGPRRSSFEMHEEVDKLASHNPKVGCVSCRACRPTSRVRCTGSGGVWLQLVSEGRRRTTKQLLQPARKGKQDSLAAEARAFGRRQGSPQLPRITSSSPAAQPSNACHHRHNNHLSGSILCMPGSILCMAVHICCPISWLYTRYTHVTPDDHGLHLRRRRAASHRMS